MGNGEGSNVCGAEEHSGGKVLKSATILTSCYSPYYLFLSSVLTVTG